MSLPTPLRAIAASDPATARTLILDALAASGGHRARAAAILSKPRGRGREPWLPATGGHWSLWRCIVALDMGDEVRARWPAPSDPRGQP